MSLSAKLSNFKNLLYLAVFLAVFFGFNSADAETITVHDNVWNGTTFNQNMNTGTTSVQVADIWVLDRITSTTATTTYGTTLHSSNFGVGIRTQYLGHWIDTDGYYLVTMNHDPDGGNNGGGSYVYVEVIGGVYYFSYTPPEGALNLEPIDTSTHIVKFLPEEGTTTTSNLVKFSIDAYINPSDIGNSVGITFTLHNIDENVVLASFASPSDIYFLDNVQATTSGMFHYASTTIIADGNYRINAKLQVTELWGWIKNIFSPLNQDLSHTFIVREGTFIGTLQQNGYKELNELMSGTSATSTQASVASCNLLVHFNMVTCLAALFIPGGDMLNSSIASFKDEIFTRSPWGYFTRLYDIWGDSATSTLPSFTVSIMTGAGNGEGHGTSTLAFDPGDMIAGAGALLDDTRDPFNGVNAQDVFEPFLKLLLAIAVIFQIINDITGSHAHLVQSGGSKEGQKMRERLQFGNYSDIKIRKH